LFIAGGDFKKLIGVDFSSVLHDVAQKNKKIFCERSSVSPEKLEFRLQDAREFEFPDGPVFLFLFDPFGEEIMAKVIQNILKSVKSKPRTFYVAYHFPVHQELFKNAGFKEVAVRKRNWKLDYPWVIFQLFQSAE
jgi:hypothetical protein